MDLQTTSQFFEIWALDNSFGSNHRCQALTKNPMTFPPKKNRSTSVSAVVGPTEAPKFQLGNSAWQFSTGKLKSLTQNALRKLHMHVIKGGGKMRLKCFCNTKSSWWPVHLEKPSSNCTAESMGKKNSLTTSAAQNIWMVKTWWIWSGPKMYGTSSSTVLLSYRKMICLI